MPEENNDRTTSGKDNAEKARAHDSRTGRRFFLPAILALVVLALVCAMAVMIFYGSSPQSKIDYSGMYAGEDPSNSYPVAGHPDRYTHSIDAMFENETDVIVTENRTAIDPTYDGLIKFLDGTKISREPYQTGHICSSFAVELHDAAEQAGIRAHIAGISFSDGNGPSHMIVAFKTTDKDIVYADATGRTQYEIKAGYPPTYRIADVVPGQPYVRHYPAPYEDFKETASMGNVDTVLFLA
ncbi:MAG TPA: hypothetical protein VGJ92_13000 [Methanocella sp.]|jgi:hypothetical protein